MEFDARRLQWTREPRSCVIEEGQITVLTAPYTDLWQRTYYGFQNDNAPVLQMETAEQYFSFTVKTEFDSKRRFDQCGVVLYLDSGNWLKASLMAWLPPLTDSSKPPMCQRIAIASSRVSFIKPLMM